MKKLPAKLSDRILVALADLEACESDPRYKIDMTTWHSMRCGKCHVCLAGAVLAQTLDIGMKNRADPLFAPTRLRLQLEELNRIRMGFVADKYGGYGDWYYADESRELGKLSNLYRTEWLPHMLDIVGRLQAEGL